jgi:hypothetical protein
MHQRLEWINVRISLSVEEEENNNEKGIDAK